MALTRLRRTAGGLSGGSSSGPSQSDLFQPEEKRPRLSSVGSMPQFGAPGFMRGLVDRGSSSVNLPHINDPYRALLGTNGLGRVADSPSYMVETDDLVEIEDDQSFQDIVHYYSTRNLTVGEKTEYTRGSLLFSATSDRISDSTRTVALFDIPRMNYEENRAYIKPTVSSSRTAAGRRSAILSPHDGGGAATMPDRATDLLAFYEPEDAHYRYLGLAHLDNPIIGRDLNRTRTTIAGSQGIKLSGRGPAYNMFSTSLRVGDQAYVLIKEVDMEDKPLRHHATGLVENKNPDRLRNTVMQYVCCTDRGGYGPFFNSGAAENNHVHTFSDPLNEALKEPLHYDRDYVSRGRIVREHWSRSDVDEDGNIIILSLGQDDGDEEALPDLIYDNYRSGRLTRVGFVIDQVDNTKMPSQDTLDKAHISREIMETLPTVYLQVVVA